MNVSINIEGKVTIDEFELSEKEAMTFGMIGGALRALVESRKNIKGKDWSIKLDLGEGYYLGFGCNG